MTTTETTIQRAAGTYYGVPFTGKIIRSRQHTCAPFPMLHTVEFDAPVRVSFLSDPVTTAMIQDAYSKNDGEGCSLKFI